MKYARLVCLMILMAAAMHVQCTNSESAAQQFKDVEALLARAGRFDLNAHVVSHGAVESDLTAKFGVANAGDVAIHLHGTMNGKVQNLMLRSDGVVTIITHDGQNQRLQPGRAMRQAVQIGFLRMGILHNLILLTQLQEPEHQKGGITPWVQVDRIRYASNALARPD